MQTCSTFVGFWIVAVLCVVSSASVGASMVPMAASGLPHTGTATGTPTTTPTNTAMTGHNPQHDAATINKVLSYHHKLSPGQQQRALVSMGANMRLRRLLADLLAGRNVSVGILGGSVSWGFYMQRGVNDWFALFTSWLQQAFPAANVASKNGCVPATTAEYASMCLEKFVDTRNVDLVFLEYSLNDGYRDSSVKTEHAMAFERLIRKLLHLPRQPAVVLMQVLPQGIRASDPPFWWSVQDHYGVLAQYYQLPWLSMRDAMWHEVVAGTPGFTVPEIYPEQEQDMQRHPSELGHRYMADAAVAMMQQVYMDALLQPINTGDEWRQRLLQVPAPMFHNNYESSNLACFVGDTLPDVVVASDGWSWVNDGTADKPKWGFSTSTVGAVLKLQLDTRMAAGSAADQQTGNVSAATAASRLPASSTFSIAPVSSAQPMQPNSKLSSSPEQQPAADAVAQDSIAAGVANKHSSVVSQQQPSSRQLSGLPQQNPTSVLHAAKHANSQTADVSTALAPIAAADASGSGTDWQLHLAADNSTHTTPTPTHRHNSSSSQQIATAAAEARTGGIDITRGSSDSSTSTAAVAAADLQAVVGRQPAMLSHISLPQAQANLPSLPGEAQQPVALLQTVQPAEHSAEWWEAQQAQEEQQERSKLEESNRGWQEGDVLLWLGYTKTWRGAGKASVSCLGGCSCRSITVDGHHRWKTTQSYMAKLYTTQAANCTLQVEVLPKSSSNGTYFKVSGVMLTRRISSYDNSDYTDTLLLNAIEGEDYKLKTEG